nr:ribonuclease R [Flavobacteriia bacterium]
MSKQKKSAPNHQRNNIVKALFTLLEQNENTSFTYTQIAERLQIKEANAKNILIKKLVSLKEQKRILEPEKGYYQAVNKLSNQSSNRQYHEGTVDITGKGNAYII